MNIETIIERGGSVGQLATRLGVSHSTVCDWRRAGVIPAARAVQISREFDIPIDDVLALVRVPSGERLERVEA